MRLEDEFKWECPKCGQNVFRQGPASLNWARQNHEYWEHERKPNIGMPSAGRAATSFPDVLVKGLAALDDAYFDGARLTVFDLGFLRAMRLDWKKQDLRP